MNISEWMTKNVILTNENSSMLKARKILKDRRIRRLPVVDAENRLVGIVTESDITKAAPSSATTLDEYEMTYMLSEILVKDIMTPNPACIGADESVEKAALIMRDRKIGGLPVVDANHKVVGIITDTDIFRVLISITGIDQGGVQMSFRLSTAEGSLKAVMDDLRRYEARILSVLSSYGRIEGERTVSIRIHSLPADKEQQLHEELAARYTLVSWT